HRQSTAGVAIGVLSTVGRVTGEPASATVYTAGAPGVAYAWSDVETVTRNRCPAWNSCTIAGSVTVAGRASAMDSGSPVRWTGATRPFGSEAPFCGSTSYSLTNSTASPVGDAALSCTVGAPTMSTVDGSGAETKSACCPGISSTRPLV